MATTILVLAVLLICGFVGTRIATLVRLPHSVFLVVLGVAAGLLMRAHGSVFVQQVTTAFPDVILYLLLPPLVFEASYHLDARLLRRDLLPIAALAVVAMLVSAAVIGYVLHWAFNFPFLPSLTFGALISATDPIAVVALFKEVGAPRRLTTLIESESLLNDGTAIVLFRVLLALTLAGAAGPGLLPQAAVAFPQVAGGGLAVGLIIGFVCRLLLRFTVASASAQLGLTVAAAYVSYLVAEVHFGVSGVMATMMTGIVIGRAARLELNKAASLGMQQIWEFIALTANIVVFFFVGLSVDPMQLAAGAAYIPLTILAVYAARALSVFTVVPLVNALRLAQPITLAYQAVLVWGGLRGGLALGLALLLPPAFPHRDVYFVLALAVVLANMLLNAVTTKPVLRMLRLDRLEPQEELFYAKALELMRSAVRGPLVRAVEAGALSQTVAQGQLAGTPLPTAAGPAPTDQADLRFGLSDCLLQEQRAYDSQLRDGLLQRAAYVTLTQTVAERLDALQQGDESALRAYDFPVIAESRLERLMIPLIQHVQPNIMLRRLTTKLGVLIGLRFTLEDVARGAHDDAARGVVQGWILAVDKLLQAFNVTYPHYVGAVQAFFVADAVQAHSRRHVDDLLNAGVITQAVATRAGRDIAAWHRRGTDEAWELLRPSPAYLLARVPRFQALGRVSHRQIADAAKRRVVATGQTVVREGEPVTSFFLVIAGMLEEQPSRGGAPQDGRRLFTGDVIGVAALDPGRVHLHTVVALTTTELMEIDARTLRHIVEQYPVALGSAPVSDHGPQ